DVINACYHLMLRQREGESRIQYGKLRHHFIAEHMTYLQLALAIGYHRAAVHLGARAYHSQHAPYGDYLACRLFKPHVVLFPWVIITMNRNGNGFGIIAA